MQENEEEREKADEFVKVIGTFYTLAVAVPLSILYLESNICWLSWLGLQREGEQEEKWSKVKRVEEGRITPRI